MKRVKWARALSWISVIILIGNGVALSWYRPANLSAYTAFIASSGVAILLGIIQFFIGMTAQVRSIFPKPKTREDEK